MMEIKSQGKTKCTTENKPEQYIYREHTRNMHSIYDRYTYLMDKDQESIRKQIWDWSECMTYT